MATATATVTIDNYPTGIDYSQKLIYVRGTVAIQASPATYATGGLTLSWVNEQLKSPLATPVDAWFYSAGAAGTTVGGYGYLWNKANNKLVIMAAATVTAGTGPQQQEMTNTTAIPAAVSNDTIRFEAVFQKADL